MMDEGDSAAPLQQAAARERTTWSAVSASFTAGLRAEQRELAY